MATIQDVSTSSYTPQIDLPIDPEEQFEEMLRDPVMDTPDMRVEGNWTYHQAADFMAMREFTEGTTMDWGTLREVDFANTTDLFDAGAYFNLEPPGQLAASFGAGDPGIGVGVGNGYAMWGRSGSASALERNGTAVVVADRGERGIAFDPPGPVELAQMIVRDGWGYQMSAVASVFERLPGIGSSNAWKVPAFGTVNGPINMLAAYNYSFSPAIFGMPAFATTFDLNPKRDTTFRFSLLDNAGEAITSTDVDVPEAGQSVQVFWANTPATGKVSLDAGGVPYVIENTDVTPPTL